jgi:ligand-binding sensor domain-containing protein
MGNWIQIRGVSGVHQILEDQDSGLWVADVEGLFNVRDGKAIRYHPNQILPSRIGSIYQDSTGAFWVTTDGVGLFRLRDGQSKAISAKDSLLNGMLIDMSGGRKGQSLGQFQSGYLSPQSEGTQ